MWSFLPNMYGTYCTVSYICLELETLFSYFFLQVLEMLLLRIVMENVPQCTIHFYSLSIYPDSHGSAFRII
jgi:hypothetical protein